jgi:hypothetical protein
MTDHENGLQQDANTTIVFLTAIISSMIGRGLKVGFLTYIWSLDGVTFG